KTISKIRYHIKRIQVEDDSDHTADWQTIVEAVAGLVQDGVPPSNSEVRDLLLPILEDLPESLELPRNFQLVLREIDRYLASRASKPEAEANEEPSENVRRAAALLAGRSVVLIGGERRPQAAEALEEAFGLKEVIWVEGREQTYTAFEPHVANPD